MKANIKFAHGFGKVTASGIDFAKGEDVNNLCELIDLALYAQDTCAAEIIGVQEIIEEVKRDCIPVSSLPTMPGVYREFITLLSRSGPMYSLTPILLRESTVLCQGQKAYPIEALDVFDSLLALEPRIDAPMLEIYAMDPNELEESQLYAVVIVNKAETQFWFRYILGRTILGLNGLCEKKKLWSNLMELEFKNVESASTVEAILAYHTAQRVSAPMGFRAEASFFMGFEHLPALRHALMTLMLEHKHTVESVKYSKIYRMVFALDETTTVKSQLPIGIDSTVDYVSNVLEEKVDTLLCQPSGPILVVIAVLKGNLSNCDGLHLLKQLPSSTSEEMAYARRFIMCEANKHSIRDAVERWVLGEDTTEELLDNVSQIPMGKTEIEYFKKCLTHIQKDLSQLRDFSDSLDGNEWHWEGKIKRALDQWLT
jgi:hypothetical protein